MHRMPWSFYSLLVSFLHHQCFALKASPSFRGVTSPLGPKANANLAIQAVDARDIVMTARSRIYQTPSNRPSSLAKGNHPCRPRIEGSFAVLLSSFHSYTLQPDQSEHQRALCLTDMLDNDGRRFVRQYARLIQPWRSLH